MTDPVEQSEPFPWADLGGVWYAALVDGGETFGLARRTPQGSDVRYETWNRDTLAWQPTYEGIGFFSEIGGITNAVPIDEPEAMRILAALGGPGGA